ncbi:hypothetical protein L596_003702 [Steinernema carpocapsae]|uniref:Uncharacterized protein n=1 Tax=Steinernema carpocapsae TaxID=34508 RepID=A0A4U8UWQ3_STECR|nr:hypothetical protein L596_003702 [Steinernema carpocapsae]
MRIERKAEGDFMKQMDTIADRNREFLKNEEPHRPCDGSTQHAPLAPSISVQGNAAFALLKQVSSSS